jgi:hypothetical protein
MMHDDECGAVSGMRNGRGNGKCSHMEMLPTCIPALNGSILFRYTEYLD